MSTNTYLRQKSIRCKFNTEEWCRMVVNQVSYSYKSTATILRIDGNSGCGLMFYETELSIAPPQIRGTYVGSKDGQNMLCNKAASCESSDYRRLSVRMKGLEPPRPETSDPKSDAATITPHARNCVQSYDFLVKVQLLHAKNDCSTAETECREEARCAVGSNIGSET